METAGFLLGLLNTLVVAGVAYWVRYRQGARAGDPATSAANPSGPPETPITDALLLFLKKKLTAPRAAAAGDAEGGPANPGDVDEDAATELLQVLLGVGKK